MTLALDDGAAPASLFAFSVWNGARRLAAHLTQHPRLVHGRTVVEFGAAGALPSLAALRLGCRFALLTDFPAAPLLGAMRRTLADPRNAPVLGRGLDRCAAVRGHLWGADPTPLLAALPDDGEARAGGGGFDVALVGECLWLHHQHANLLASIHGCLRPGGQVREGRMCVCVYREMPGWIRRPPCVFSFLSLDSLSATRSPLHQTTKTKTNTHNIDSTKRTPPPNNRRSSPSPTTSPAASARTSPFSRRQPASPSGLR